MKKRNVKSLSLNKKSISNFDTESKIKGGRASGLQGGNSCYVCWTNDNASLCVCTDDCATTFCPGEK